MTIIDLKIREQNKEAHKDIEMAMSKHKGKWFHFEVRISGSNITDFIVREQIDYAKFKQG
jgi:hypothetical protein